MQVSFQGSTPWRRPCGIHLRAGLGCSARRSAAESVPETSALQANPDSLSQEEQLVLEQLAQEIVVRPLLQRQASACLAKYQMCTQFLCMLFRVVKQGDVLCKGNSVAHQQQQVAFQQVCPFCPRRWRGHQHSANIKIWRMKLQPHR